LTDFVFHFDNGLRFTTLDLAVDMRRRQARGFISHAHADHMARHELAYCTPTTAALYQHRFGPRATHAMPYGENMMWGECSLSTHPACRVLVSAMMLVQVTEGSVLYSGDIKLCD
jgi:Cft2 family RNA processing exonuclease